MQSITKLHQYRWIVQAVAWASCLALYLSRLSIGPLAPFLKDAFHLSNAQVGSLASAAGMAYAPTMLVAGWLVDRIGVRRILIIGTLICGLSGIAIFFAPSYNTMFSLLVLTGVGAGCIFPSAVKAVVLWFSRRERGTVLGLNQSALNVAGIIGATLLPSIAITVGWRWGFLLVGVGTLAICLLCVALYWNPTPEQNFRRHQEIFHPTRIPNRLLPG